MNDLLSDVLCTIPSNLVLKRIHRVMSGSVWVSDYVGSMNAALPNNEHRV